MANPITKNRTGAGKKIDEEIKSITSKLTIVDGKIVYGNKDYPGLAPAAFPVIPLWSPVKYFGGYQP